MNTSAPQPGVPQFLRPPVDGQWLLTLGQRLGTRIIGQDGAIQVVVGAVLRAAAGFSDPHQPLGAYLCVGPSGVGKTELAKALAKELGLPLIRIDMGEYAEKHTVSRWIGSPPGYADHAEGGQLTARVQAQPYSLILFDEIEKAHPEVLNALLQVLDDARMTDGQGRTVSFARTIIIMTSNVGATTILDEENDHHLATVLRQHFRTEFLNRLTVVVFRPLSAEALVQVTRQTLGRILRDQVEPRHLHVQPTDAVIRALIEEGYDAALGARPLTRLINIHLLDPLAAGAHAGLYSPGDEVVFDHDAEGGYQLRRAPGLDGATPATLPSPSTPPPGGLPGTDGPPPALPLSGAGSFPAPRRPSGDAAAVHADLTERSRRQRTECQRRQRALRAGLRGPRRQG